MAKSKPTKPLYDQFDLRVRTAIELHKHEFPTRNWLIEPWLRQRMLVMVHAPTGVGKTWFCWSLALSLASGKDFADWRITKPRKVLIIDGEMQPDDLKDRLDVLRKYHDLDKENEQPLKRNLIIISRQDQHPDTIFPDLNLIEDQDELLEIINEINPDLVVLDNLSTLANLEDENAAHAYNDIFRFLTKIKQQRSAIVVHHDKKGSTDKSEEGFRGSSKLGAIFEQRIALSKHDNYVSGKGACFKAEFKKNRYLGNTSMEKRVFTLVPKTGW